MPISLTKGAVMADLTIDSSDLAYARGQVGRVNKLVFGDRPWEACLLAQEAWVSDGRSLGECILDGLMAIKERNEDGETHRSVRSMLTVVFAPVFRASTFSLPIMGEAELAAMDKAYSGEMPGASFDNLFEDVRIMMSYVSKSWAELLFAALAEEKIGLMPSDRRFVLCCARLLVAKLLEDKKHEQPEKKADTKKANTSTRAKAPESGLKPITNTGVLFNNVGGCREAKRQMMELSWILSQPEAAGRWGVRPPRGVLLYGPPGTGKTLLVHALVSHSSRVLFQIKMSDLFSMWYGLSMERLSQIFAQARAAKGAILFFDEADGVIANRRQERVHEESGRVVTQFNLEMESVAPEDKLTVILATNIKERLDEASVRDQRIDRMIPVALPDLAERQEILFVHRTAARDRAGRSIFANDVDLSKLAGISDGLSGAALAHVIERALWEKVLHDLRDGVGEDLVTHADLVRSIRERLAERKDAEHRIGFSAPAENLKTAVRESDFSELLEDPSPV